MKINKPISKIGDPFDTNIYFIYFNVTFEGRQKQGDGVLRDFNYIRAEDQNVFVQIIFTNFLNAILSGNKRSLALFVDFPHKRSPTNKFRKFF